MKKLILIVFIVIFILSLTGCPTPHDSVLSPFEEAVQEVYEMTGRTLFYSSNGRTMDIDVVNRVSGPNEIPGVCTDYSIEFAYYWNEIMNYDDLFGKAYISRTPVNGTNFYILDGNFVKNGTSKLREESGDFIININNQEIDGVYRDVIVTSIIYSGKNIQHYGDYQISHVWVVIKIGNNWFDTEPTAYDMMGGTWIPRKINFN